MFCVGSSPIRKDAYAKASGKTKYTDDLFLPGTLHAKLKRSTIPSGRVTHIDTTAASQLPGVVAIYTYLDVPDTLFPTAGHPYALEPESRDVADRRLLTGDIRIYGDEIAVVVATDELTAEHALEQIQVEYEAYPPILDGREAIAPGAREIHRGTHNVIRDTVQQAGDTQSGFQQADFLFEQEYQTQIVQHCAMENHTAYAYIGEDQRITVVSSTQIPHICRRIIGQALSLPVGQIRVIKPAVGGGFGSKQDVVLEPLVAFLTMKLGGRPVSIRYTREETFLATRTRHPMYYKLKAGYTKDGSITAWTCEAISSGGGYASHGHSCIGRGCNKIYAQYPIPNYSYHAVSTYTNTPVAGAMRAYGTPQIMFMFESAMDDMARQLGMSPIEFRKKNLLTPDFVEPTTGMPIQTYGILDCYDAGMKAIRYEQTAADNRRYNQEMARTGKALRRGLGMASICYNPFSYPGCLDAAGAMLILNQDGSVMLHVGAAEIGQGSDCVLSQIAAEALGIAFDQVHIVSTQDTDVSPFDSGAYSSRQTYVSGQAVKLAGLELRGKILQYAYERYHIPADSMELTDGVIRYKETGAVVVPLSELAMDCYYNKAMGRVLSARVSHNQHTNALIFGACFVNVEVDIALCRVKVLELHEVMDVGRLINPELARGQVLGCVSMGLGYALSEELLIDPHSGRVHNGNLLDYKLQTILDTPEIDVIFIEHPEPNGPYGAKGLGEPPTVPVAPAVRNAVLDATGVAVNRLPLSPQNLYEQFKAAGLLSD